MSTEIVLAIVGIVVSLLVTGAIIKVKRIYKVTQNKNIVHGDIVGRDKK